MTEAATEGFRPLPLDGVKVIDLSRVLAGPWATMSLADLGAEGWNGYSPKQQQTVQQGA